MTVVSVSLITGGKVTGVLAGIAIKAGEANRALMVAAIPISAAEDVAMTMITGAGEGTLLMIDAAGDRTSPAVIAASVLSTAEDRATGGLDAIATNSVVNARSRFPEAGVGFKPGPFWFGFGRAGAEHLARPAFPPSAKWLAPGERNSATIDNR